jgi:hypothetical protein
VKKHSNSVKESESPMKRRNPRAEERRDSSEVMAELVSQLRQQLEEKSVPAAQSAGDERDAVRPNLDRLTVGVDLGDQWRHRKDASYSSHSSPYKPRFWGRECVVGNTEIIPRAAFFPYWRSYS